MTNTESGKEFIMTDRSSLSNEARKAPAKLTYSVAEVADLMGISKSAAYDCIRTGEIPSIKLGRRLLVPVQAIDRLVESALA